MSAHQKPTMRKYYQLTLVVVSVISVVSLLIYRHEYNRLRYVLEVLNFFGTPGQSANSNDCVPLNVTHMPYDIFSFREYLPSWQLVSANFSVYSAFWENSDNGGQVKAIAIGSLKLKPKFKCHIWFEDVDEPVPGKFNFLHMDDKDLTVGNSKPPIMDGIISYVLFCKPPTTLGSPNGVTFYSPLEHVPLKPFIPIQSAEDRTVVENSTLVCVAPSIKPGTSKLAVFEFLSYHQVIGINDFIVYDQTLSTQLPIVLQNRVIQERYNMRVMFLPWNFPFPATESEKAVRLAVEKDCIMRTMGKIRNIVVLSWNEYIVPKFSRSLAVMLDNLNSKKKIATRFDIPTLTFCTNLPDDPQADVTLPVAARKTKCLKGSGLDKMFHVYRPLQAPGNKTGTIQTVSQGIAAVHRYTNCLKDVKGSQIPEDNLMYEPTVLMKFAGEMKRSKFLRAGVTHKLFL